VAVVIGANASSKRIAGIAVLLFALFACGRAEAGTTGVISGKVIDAQTGARLAGVLVDAVSPTGRYSTKSTQAGFYAFAGVSPDTYTLTFTLQGFQSTKIVGVTVYPDQAVRVRAALAPGLKTLATVTVHASGAAYQPANTVDTYTVTQQQIQSIQGNALNTDEAKLIDSLPGSSADDAGFPSIHGGRENEHGFQMEGIPYIDPFTSQTTNSLRTPGLALKAAQLTPGAGNASFGNSGTGTINLIANKGTYPGSATLQVGVGSPSFYHALNFDFGTAAPDGKWSAYFSFAGANTNPQYGGSHAPAAALLQVFNSVGFQTSREVLANMTYRFGPSNSRSLQIFYDDAQHDLIFGYGGNPYCFKTCDPMFLADVANFSQYQNLPSGGLSTALTPQQIEALVMLDPFQSSPTQTLAQANRPAEESFQPNHALKLQYDANLDASTFLSTKFYRVNSVIIDDSVQPLGAIQLSGGLTTGVGFDMTKQMSAKHLLQLGTDYSYLHPVFDQDSNLQGIEATFLGGGDSVTGLGAGEAFDFLSPSDPNCPLMIDFGAPCGYLATYFPRGVPKVPNNLQQSISNRQDFSLYATDSMTPSERLKIELGLRLDGANYRLPAPGIDPATCTSLYLPATWTAAVVPGTCPTATFNVSRAATRPRILQPRIAFAFQFSGNDAIRFSYGRSVIFPPLGQVDLFVPPAYYASFQKVPSFDAIGSAITGATMPARCGIPGFQVTCANYADQLRWENQNAFQGVPIQPVKPELFNNYDISYERQFPSGYSFRITPWYRRGYDATALAQAPLLGPDGKPVRNPDGTFVFSPAVATNLGYERAVGAELLLTKPSAFGLSGQFSATYINEFTNVIPLSNNENFFPAIPPASLALGNLYRVGYVSPFQTSLDLSYISRGGWRFSPQIQYNIGYPNGTGLFSSIFINGIPYNVLNTNASGATNEAPNGTIQYIDPMNPGSLFSPNIVATRGTTDTAAPGGILSHPSTTFDFTLEFFRMKNQVIGLTVNDVFNALYSGPQINTLYQPVATGYAGPLSGFDINAYDFPNQGFANQPSFVHGKDAYINLPNAPGRTIYFYYQIKT
jgi:hypothetical protein